MLNNIQIIDTQNNNRLIDNIHSSEEKLNKNLQETAQNSQENTNKKSRPLTSKGAKNHRRANAASSDNRNIESADNKNIKHSDEESDKETITHNHSRNLSQYNQISKNNSHYDNKSTTIIIHDKDITTDNLHISVYKKRKDRSLTNEPNDEILQKYSARHIKDNKLSDRDNNRVEFATISKNSPFQKYYINNNSGAEK